MLYVPCELVHHVYNEDETIAIAYAMIDERSGSCAANLKTAGSWRFNQKNPDQGSKTISTVDHEAQEGRERYGLESVNDLYAFEAHRESEERAGRSLLAFPEHLDEDLSWKAFNDRYCQGEILLRAKEVRAAIDRAGATVAAGGGS